eukprot:gene7102-12750_t
MLFHKERQASTRIPCQYRKNRAIISVIDITWAGPIPSTAASFQNLSISNPRFFKTKGHSTSTESGISGNPAAFNPSGPRPNSMQANWSSTSHGAGPIPSTAASFQNLSISNPRFFKTKGHSTSAESGISGNPAAFNPSGPRPNSMQANWNLEQSIYVPPPMRAESAASAYGSPRPVRDISSKKELKIIRITDPKQGGKDVTHEILRAKK